MRLFAALRELAGEGWLEVDGPDVASIRTRLVERFGARFAEISEAGTVVVNGEVVGTDAPVGPEDEVAFLPPVSGG